MTWQRNNKLNSRDFTTKEENGQITAVQSTSYWTVDKGGMLITGKVDGQDILEFSSKPIKNKSALVKWALEVFY